MTTRLSTRTRRDERGLAVPIVGISLVFLVTAVALAVDLGRLSALAADLRKVADIVAVDSARLIDGSDHATLDPVVQAAALDSAARNDFVPSGSRSLTVELGQWDDDMDTFDPTSGVEIPNAVRVTATDLLDYVFRPGSTTPDRDAVAIRSPQANVKVGSLAAGVDAEPPSQLNATATVNLLNSQLQAFLGVGLPESDLSLGILGYQGLAAADVELDRVAAAAGFASPDEMAQSTMTVGTFLDATATALEGQAADGDPNAAAAAAQIRNIESDAGVNGSSTMSIGDYLDIEQGNGQSAAESSINVLDFLTGSASTINGTNFLTYDFATGIPGVLSATVTQATIERPTIRYGAIGTTARTSQTRYRIDVRVDNTLVPGVLTTIRIPLVLEAARATATLTRTDCFEPLTDSEDDINVVTSAAAAHIGTVSDADLANPGSLTVSAGVILQGGPANISLLSGIGLLLPPLYNVTADVTGTSTTSVGGGTSDHTFFPKSPPDENKPNQPTNPKQRAAGGFDEAAIEAGLTSGLTTTLGGAATTQFLSNLSTVFGNLGNQLLNPLSTAAGVTFGGADVHSYWMRCSVPQLVQ